MAIVIDILMPIYNSAPYLRQALESLRAQSLTAWRLIAVDDGSTDESVDILLAMQRYDARIQLLRNPENLGLGISRQRALDAASAPFCGVLDSDDVADPDWLSCRLQRLEKDSDIVALSGSRRLVDAHGRKCGERLEPLSGEEADWALHFGNPIVNSSTVFRRMAAQAIGGYPPLRYLEDWALFRRLRQCGRIVQEKRIAVSYRVHSSSSSLAVARRHEMLRVGVQAILGDVGDAQIATGVGREAAWVLFRGKFPEPVSNAALDAAYAVLLRRYSDLEPSVRGGGRLPALVIDDVNNLLRCSPPTRAVPWRLIFRDIKRPTRAADIPPYARALSRFIYNAIM